VCLLVGDSFGVVLGVEQVLRIPTNSAVIEIYELRYTVVGAKLINLHLNFMQGMIETMSHRNNGDLLLLNYSIHLFASYLTKYHIPVTILLEKKNLLASSVLKCF
jgi:hypothetical protein